MHTFRDFDDVAALSSFGLTRGSLVRMITQEANRSGVLADGSRLFRFDGNGCALESARGGRVALLIGAWIARSRRKFRTALPRPGVPAL
jgi:hypothetical protein